MIPIEKNPLPSTFNIKEPSQVLPNFMAETTLTSAHQTSDTEASSNCFLELINTIWTVIKSIFSWCCAQERPIDPLPNEGIPATPNISREIRPIPDESQNAIRQSEERKRIHQAEREQYPLRQRKQISAIEFRDLFRNQPIFVTEPNTTLVITDVSRPLLEKLVQSVKQQGDSKACIRWIWEILNHLLLSNSYCLKATNVYNVLIETIHEQNSLILSSSRPMKFEVHEGTLKTTLENLYDAIISADQQFTLAPGQALALILSPTEVGKILGGKENVGEYLQEIFHNHVPQNYELQYIQFTAMNIQKTSFVYPPGAVGLTLTCPQPIIMTLSPK